jgi:hypothetical protein
MSIFADMNVHAGLKTPATKVWEIPEPKPAYAPEPPAKERERAPEPVPEREKVPAGV